GGYEVAFTSGHTTPVADLMAVSPAAKTMFLIDVKGLYRPNPWLIKRKPIRDNLFYVLAFVPVALSNFNHQKLIHLKRELSILRSALIHQVMHVIQRNEGVVSRRRLKLDYPANVPLAKLQAVPLKLSVPVP